MYRVVYRKPGRSSWARSLTMSKDEAVRTTMELRERGWSAEARSDDAVTPDIEAEGTVAR